MGKKTRDEKEKIISWANRLVDKYKSYFGFSNFTITINDASDTVQDEDFDAVATIDVEPHDHAIRIDLFKRFFDSDRNKEDALIHELLHGRLAMFQINVEAKTKSLMEEEEDQMINEITMGFMKLLNKRRNNGNSPEPVVTKNIKRRTR